MSVKVDPDGRRWVQVEAEIPGTPEDVWQAIATGPGISSWFIPTEFEAGPDGTPSKVISHFGPTPDMDNVAAITAWEPPHRFAAEGPMGIPDAPAFATEWFVEARSGGVCVVRVVHSFFADSDEWDEQLTGAESGWPGFFRILRLYATHFRGQSCKILQLMGMSAAPEDEVWTTLTGALGLAGAHAGERRSTAAQTPPLSGIVEWTGEGTAHHVVLLRLDEPGPGIVSLGAFFMGGQVCVVMNFYLYGEGASAIVERDGPQWQAWLNEKLPAPAGAEEAVATA
jgi:uncharacterized protein YndB with AHSA1/START domain